MTDDLFLVLHKDDKLQLNRTCRILTELGYTFKPIQHAQLRTAKWRGITACVPPGAWAEAMRFLSELPQLPERTWFIEDDVMLHREEFGKLVDWTRVNAPDTFCSPYIITRQMSPRWGWWHKTFSDFGSFNQLCVLGRSILQLAMTAEVANFHEVWFPELSIHAGKIAVCWQDVPELAPLFGPWQFRPLVEPGPGLRHPVKSNAEA